MQRFVRQTDVTRLRLEIATFGHVVHLRGGHVLSSGLVRVVQTLGVVRDAVRRHLRLRYARDLETALLFRRHFRHFERVKCVTSTSTRQTKAYSSKLNVVTPLK